MQGAQKFLLASYPDISTFPYRAYIKPTDIQILHNYSLSLREEISKLATPPSQMAYVDGFGLFQQFSNKPTHFGFNASLLEKSCLTGAYAEVPQRTLCDDPDEYVYWDEYHVRFFIFVILANSLGFNVAHD
jgi:phospholipase/lecithinase/hemolysin